MMNCKCQIHLIHDGGKTTDLRQCTDGYFTGVGKQLHDAMMNSENAVDFISYLLERESSYQLVQTNYKDIKYYYELNFDILEAYGWKVEVDDYGEPILDSKGKVKLDESSKINLLNVHNFD